MRYELIFMTAVLAIAGIHLLTGLVNFMARFRRAGAARSGKGSRIEWYVFFESSALRGNRNSAAAPTGITDEGLLNSGRVRDEVGPVDEIYA
ncbi:MAG: hypothetical protein ABR523_05490 [Desulfurivibrionaceae bacterium]